MHDAGARRRPTAPSTKTPRFADLNLPDALLRAVADEGYETPTAIQAQSIPPALEGRDLLGTAKTGTGKTAAFLLPILARLGPRPRRGIRVLVVAPTRELAAQIGERAEAYGRHQGLRVAVIFGGVNQRRQETALRRDPSVVVATPGRLLDLVDQRLVRLDDVDVLVLDEADRMFDMGFLPAVKRIVSHVPEARQTLLFSATMPKEVTHLAHRLLRDPVRVSVDPPEETPTIVEQSVHLVERPEKRPLLLRVLRGPDVTRAIVFMRTKRGANRLAQQLEKGGITAAAIHGNKSQNARNRALDGFKDGSTPVLVATDLAARGIDVKDVSHVINFELPDTPESYVHRIGRTGRAGAAGKAISFCDPSERTMLRDIERKLSARIPVAAASAPADAGPRAATRPAEQHPREAPRPPRERPSRAGAGAVDSRHERGGAGRAERRGDDRGAGAPAPTERRRPGRRRRAR